MRWEGEGGYSVIKIWQVCNHTSFLGEELMQSIGIARPVAIEVWMLSTLHVFHRKVHVIQDVGCVYLSGWF